MLLVTPQGFQNVKTFSGGQETSTPLSKGLSSQFRKGDREILDRVPNQYAEPVTELGNLIPGRLLFKAGFQSPFIFNTSARI